MMARITKGLDVVCWIAKPLLVLAVITVCVASTIRTSNGRYEDSPSGQYRSHVTYIQGASAIKIEVWDNRTDSIVTADAIPVAANDSDAINIALDTQAVSFVWQADESSVAIEGLPGKQQVKINLFPRKNP